MKKLIRALLAVMLAGVCVFMIGTGMKDSRLKASEDNGNTTAVEQQAEKKEEAKPVEVTVPEKKEEPKEEPRAEEPRAEEPKAEEPAEEEPEAGKPAEEEAKDEEPAAEEPAEEETGAEAADETAAPNVEVTIRMKNQGDVQYGDRITLEADAKGNCDFSLQWQVKEDKEWKDIPGETGDTYSFVLTEENAGFNYRVVATTR